MGGAALRYADYAVVGVGNSLYEGCFNVVGAQVDAHLKALGAHRLHKCAQLDEQQGDLVEQLDSWCEGLLTTCLAHPLKDQSTRNTTSSNWCPDVTDRSTLPSSPVVETKEKNHGNGFKGNRGLAQADLKEQSSESDDSENEDVSQEVDIEDLGQANPGVANKREAQTASASGNQRKEMVNPIVRASLTKQGYKIIGSHSGVKLCRCVFHPLFHPPVIPQTAKVLDLRAKSGC